MPIALVILLNSCLAMSLDWWAIPREEGPNHLSYVASSEGEESLEELKEKAFMAAAVIIVRENFGTTVEASESMIEETGNSKYQFQTKIKSDPMIIKGLKLTDLKILESGTKTRVLVRVTISKEDLAQAVREQNRDQAENIYGKGKGENFVLVKTSPQGALIQITGIDKKYFVQGNGDARFYLPLGEYNISINEDGYAPVTRTFKIDHRNEELSFDLTPILGKFSIRTNPADAQVLPLSSVKGDNPFYLSPHKKYRFRVSHPDFFEEEFEYSLSDDGSYSKSINLQRRSSSIRLIVTPEPSLISINNRHFKNRERIHLDDEELYIVIEADGYERYEKTIKVDPNRYFPDEYIKLSPKKENPPFKWPKLPSLSFFKDEPLIKRFEYNPYVQLDGRGNFSILPLSFYLEKGFFGAGLSYNYIDSYQDDGEKSVQKSISDISFSLRFILKNLGSIAPYLTLTVGSYHAKQSTDDLESIEETEREYSYHGFGGGLRYYFSNTSSIHAEMIHISKDAKDNINQNTDDPKKSSEVKAVVGLGWEF